MKVVVTSGYYNPIHKGHIRLMEEARKLGDYLVVIVNNDEQVKLKGSKPFMDEDERLEIVKSLRCVNHAVLSIDKDRTVCKTIEMLRPQIFAKGGDSTPENVPEQKICDIIGCNIIYDVGGNKIQSSSWLKATL